MVAVLTVLGLGNILNAGFEQILIMYNPTAVSYTHLVFRTLNF